MLLRSRKEWPAVLFSLHKDLFLPGKYSVNCTHLEGTMKTFIAALLLTACAAYVTAEHMAFHKAVFQFLDKRHDERMTQILRDNGLPEDTIPANDRQEKAPEWMVNIKSSK